jgi:hypothetical protein
LILFNKNLLNDYYINNNKKYLRRKYQK